ncbi:hypothetical protein F4801DRAFT_316823 [Xylaria longipes]|nr:hypothetical protein F4801DRAFT_316823 [Xylaria longipes]
MLRYRILREGRPASSDDVSSSLKIKPKIGRLCSFPRAILFISIAINCILFFLMSSRKPRALSAYSPAAGILSYKPVVFSSGFGVQKSPFQGPPSDENNKLWQDLYSFGVSRIITEEARALPNKTLPVPDIKSGYVIHLAIIFHQLHCLNRLRLAIYGAVDMSGEDDLQDVTPLTFARERQGKTGKAVADVLHSCRNFIDIQRWAWERRFHEAIDFASPVRDDPLGWGDYEQD